jgi:Leucine-rich repeat (LRR) protein
MKIKSFLLLSVCMMLGTSAFATVDVKQNNVGYEKAGGGDGSSADKAISLKVCAAFATDNLTIADAFSFNSELGAKYYKVIGFNSGWEASTETGAKDASGMKTLTITATNMSDLSNAFSGLSGLESLTVTNGTWTDVTNVTSVAPKSTITTLNLSGLSAVKKITATFGAAWAKLATLTLPANLEEIPANCFAGSVLKSVTLPAGVTKLPASAFANSALESFDLTGITEIGMNAFNGCSAANFKSLTIPASIADGKIGSNAFANMSSLETVTITNNNLKKIDTWFAGDNAIKSVSITSTSATEIAAGAFSGASADLTTLDLSGCTALKTVASNSFPANAYTSVKLNGTAIEAYYDTDGNWKGANFDNVITWIGNSTASLTEFTFPAGVKVIPAKAFQYFTAIASIGLPAGLVEIESSAFEGATSLNKITFKGYLATIGDDAFNGCTKLASADFTKATELKTIGNNAFDGTALTALDLTSCAKLETIGDDAFAGTKITAIDLSGCEKLTKVSGIWGIPAFPVNEYTSVKLAGTNLVYYDKTTDPATYVDNFTGEFQTILSKSAKTLTEITLPSALEAIPNTFFQNFVALTSISLPKAVTSIGANAFEGSGLTAFKVRENVATIGDDAFNGCAALATVNFSEAKALTTIGDRAFLNCEALATVTFTEATALTKVGDNAFQNTAIKEVAIPANADGNGLIIGDAAFMDCAKLKSFSAKSWAGPIAVSLFENDAKLTGIQVPATITSIEASAFENTGLASITFKHTGDEPVGLAYIDDRAFFGCSALTSLDLSLTQLPGLDDPDIFTGCTSLATITFPEEGFWYLGDGLSAADGLFADCPIETLNAPEVTVSDILFGYYHKKGALTPRNAKNPNTTLKSVVIGGKIPTGCFAYCTALESVEYYNAAPSASDVDSWAFYYCENLATFTYEPESSPTVKTIDDQAFIGCTPYVFFATNQYYMDQAPMAPLNTTYDGESIMATTVKTVQDKANANQSFGKYYNSSIPVYFKAADCKVFTAYVDGDVVYYQAARTVGEGFYNIPAKTPVIIKTDEPTEVNFKLGTYPGDPTTSTGWDDMYCSEEGDDLAAVQLGAGLAPGQYLYRLTNTDDQGFGFTHFSGTTIKTGQFFIASTKKPSASGRLSEVWLDEDGNVIDGEATAIQNIEKAAEQNDGAIYNLQGVRVQKAQKGLYIQNGKKFFVK